MSTAIQKCPAPGRIKFTIFAIQPKLTRCAEKQENKTQADEKKTSIEGDIELTPIIRVIGKNITAALSAVFPMLKKREGRWNILGHGREDMKGPK